MLILPADEICFSVEYPVMRTLFSYWVGSYILSMRAPPRSLAPSPRKGNVYGHIKRADVLYRAWSRILGFVVVSQVFIVITASMLHSLLLR